MKNTLIKNLEQDVEMLTSSILRYQELCKDLCDENEMLREKLNYIAKEMLEDIE